jgi:hypothetical protein
LPIVPWDDIRCEEPFGITERQWIEQYARPSFVQQFEKNIPWELGKFWSVREGFNQLLKSLSTNRMMQELFIQGDKGIQWQKEDGRVVVYINFQVERDKGRTRKIKSEQREESLSLSTSAFETPLRTRNMLFDDDESFVPPLSSPGLLPIIPIKRQLSTSPSNRTSPGGGNEDEEDQEEEELPRSAGPAARTRNIQSRRPAQKQRRVVRSKRN